MRPALTVLHRIRRRIALHRRPLAALCAGLAAIVGLHLLRPAEPTLTPVWVAARDVPVGAVLRTDDLREARWPAAAASTRVDPAGLVGRTVVVPLHRGQPVSTDLVLGPTTMAGYPGRTGVAVRIPDPDAVGLLVPGDEIDLWAADPRGAGPAHIISAGAAVIAVPDQGDPGSEGSGLGRSGLGRSGLGRSGASGRLVLLAVTRAEVAAVAAAASTGFLSIAWSR